MAELGKTNITFASWITLSRLISIPIVLGLLTGQDSAPSRLWSALVFAIAALTDWLDGYIARRWHQETDLGKVLDPLVDKLVILAPMIMLVELGDLPAWSVFTIVARELLITLWRAPSATGASIWGKVKTISQIVAILALLLQIPYAIFLFWLALGLTIFSGLNYVLPIHQS
ncbi:MAG: CDP-diacylglycerol--glycerol-3-phosphate 3-phosphatidyltransferase [Cyanobacteria bacterium M5B4]|nr:MAG: CDP-diacylglycerol--glycerol-3-phosphate 3-phosphatidyltransferase [Cyanobacteria bacterium M5B4]